jgi:hypothetical protein
MLYIKMMSGEAMPDECPGKNFTLITLSDKDRMQFGEWGALYGNPANPWITNGNQDVLIVIRENSDVQETYCILGNVYIMNGTGKTISTRVHRNSGIPD